MEEEEAYGCSTSSMPAVKLALLGAGNFANNTYGPILKDIPGVEVRAVWSRSDESVRSVFELVSTYSPKVERFSGEDGLAKVLDMAEVDAVVVILPPKPALEISLRALRKGKHVLQEKPIGTSEKDIASGLAEYSAMGEWRPIWGVAENYRFEDVYLNAKKLISDKLGGEVIHINLSASLALNEGSCYWHTPWRHSAEDCPGGYLFEGPVHFMAALRMLSGQTTGGMSCSAVAESRHPDLNQLDTLAGWMKLETKPKTTTCSISITYAAVVPRVIFNVTCSNGNLEIERVPGKYLLRLRPKGKGAQNKPPAAAEDEEERMEFAFSGIKNEIDYFAAAVQKHKQIAESGFQRKVGFTDQHFPDISAMEGFKDVQYLLALFRAAETASVQKIE